jgi:predicted neuraminidase
MLIAGGLVTFFAQSASMSSAIVTSEYVFEKAPFASAHASTIVKSREGLIAAWYGGTREGAPDVGIWLSRHSREGWTRPEEVANGRESGGQYPSWNPVLFEMPDGVITLFYKIGPSPTSWWGTVRTSRDGGRTWSNARRLPDGILGPIKNKPVRLTDGSVLSPSSTESSNSSNIWRIHFERTTDNGQTWTVVVVPVTGQEVGAIQPSILTYPNGRLQAVGRSRSRRVFETWSSDLGKTWTSPALTSLPNPNSGTDAVTLRDGRQLLVYNHSGQGRSPLNVAVSRDGSNWEAALVLESEPGEYSYPAVIQSSDGLVHITYTWRRQRIKHVTIDPAKLRTVPISGLEWPSEIR